MRVRFFVLCALALLLPACDESEEAAQVSATGGTQSDTAAGADEVLDEMTQMGAGGSAVQSGSEVVNVGYREDELTYMPQGFEGERTLPVQFWYPTHDETGQQTRYQGLFSRPEILKDASVALTEPAPVLVYSHGRQGFGQTSWFMNEYFASQGWIVMAFNHVGDGLLDSEELPEIYGIRPQDVSAAIDFLLDLPTEHPLAGLASDKIALSGHSFGGYTTLAVAGATYATDAWRTRCAENPEQGSCVRFVGGESLFEAGFTDPRVRVAMPMAPGNYNLFGAGVSAIEIPVLHMTGALDTSVSEETEGTPYWDTLMGEQHLRVQFVNGAHFTFTSMCNALGGLGANNGCGDDFMDEEEAHLVINTYAMAFARHHLFGDAHGLAVFNGETPLHSDVQVLRKSTDME